MNLNKIISAIPYIETLCCKIKKKGIAYRMPIKINSVEFLYEELLK